MAQLRCKRMEVENRVLPFDVTAEVKNWSSCRGSAETNLTKNHEVVGLIPSLTQWVKDPVLP